MISCLFFKFTGPTYLELLSICVKAIEKCEDIDRTYFGKDKQKLVKAEVDELLELLEKEPIDLGIYIHIYI